MRCGNHYVQAAQCRLINWELQNLWVLFLYQQPDPKALDFLEKPCGIFLAQYIRPDKSGYASTIR
jgi:hypothetical protein